METVAQAGQASEKHVVDSERDESRQESVATVHHLRKRHCLFLHSEAELWSSWWGRTGSSAEVEGESRTVSLVRLARLAVPRWTSWRRRCGREQSPSVRHRCR